MPKFDVTECDDLVYVRYTCPGCQFEHSVLAERWNWNHSVDRPTLSPSVRHFYNHPDGREVTTCHHFIRDGRIEFCDDCPHELAGQSLPLPNCYGTN